MDTFSRIALHEMTHYTSVDPPNVDSEMIQDVQMTGGETASGTVNAHALVDKTQADYFNPALAENNADNYAWTALDALVSRNCTGRLAVTTGRSPSSRTRLRLSWSDEGL